MHCEPYPDTVFLFSSYAPQLLYYSHFTAIIVSLVVSFFIIRKSRSLPSVILFIIAILFSLWSFIDLILWTQTDSRLLLLLWSNWFLFFSMISVLSPYFLYAFTREQDVSKFTKIFVIIIISPILLLTHVGEFGVSSFDVYACNAIEGWFAIKYSYIVSIFSLCSVLYIGFKNYRISGSSTNKQKNLFVFIGIVLFWLFFTIPTFIASINNITNSTADTFAFEQIGYFGISFLMASLAFIVVKYKAFDIKLLATQALIWTIIILVGSQFFFIRNPINYVLNGITFVGAIVSGIMIVRSVKRVDTQREQLALANQEQETLVHFITHQIKGFFTKSRNIFDTLTDMENVPEGAQRLITEGLRSDKEGVELVENILNAANMKTGKMKFDNKEIDLDAIVKKVISETNDTVTAKKLKLNYYCSASPVKFMGDEFRLRDVFKNLIQNSINYTFEGGVTIYLNKKPDHIEFIVQDTGVGLTEDDKKKLFTSGGRGVESVKYNVSSTGYGLFIVKKVIDNYNGRIWAESEGRNKGSKFTLILPF